ncbi:NACHT C-terminal helical domain 2-containing protein [Nostoc sp. MS1]|uniref:NACHT C-terminal helical domain 2-containing protein n=1 Tax=Nostoc sp. MS1 TaxID=2764711 RepID=UPI001CC440A8|nr:hypothetical protein [Nostoc sp. MS1]
MAFQQLVSHITDKRWQEVFLLTVEILNNADELLQLMKQQIDGLLTTDKKLQKFLTWVEYKSGCVKTSYKKSAIRAFYFDLDLDSPPAFIFALDRALGLALVGASASIVDHTLVLDRALARTLALACILSQHSDRDHTHFFNFTHDLTHDLIRALECLLDHTLIEHTRSFDRFFRHALAFTLDPKLQLTLQELQQQLPNLSPENLERSKQWWQNNGRYWTEELRTAITQHHNIGHDWQFNDEQKKTLAAVL